MELLTILLIIIMYGQVMTSANPVMSVNTIMTNGTHEFVYIVPTPTPPPPPQTFNPTPKNIAFSLAMSLPILIFGVGFTIFINRLEPILLR